MQFRPPLSIAVPLLALATTVLVALGVWQIARWDYKQGLTAVRDARTAAAPLDIRDTASAPRAEEIDYRRVVLTGRWDHEHSLTVANSYRFGIRGEEVVVPLLPADGGPAVLVDRGWYPLTERERVLAGLQQQATVRVPGLARDFGRGTMQRGQAGWRRFDVASMAPAVPYPVTTWGVIEGELLDQPPLTPPPTLPVQGYVRYEDTVPHLEYALTWFGMAVTLVAVAYFRLLHGRGVELEDRAATESQQGVP